MSRASDLVQPDPRTVFQIPTHPQEWSTPLADLCQALIHHTQTRLQSCIQVLDRTSHECAHYNAAFHWKG